MIVSSVVFWIGLATSMVGYTARASTPAILGEWLVTGFSLAPISAVSKEEAVALVGSKATFASNRAEFGPLHCEMPSYQTSVDPDRKVERVSIDCSNGTVMPYLYILPDAVDASLDGAIYHLKRLPASTDSR
jgi:hypothetical protein